MNTDNALLGKKKFFSKHEFFFKLGWFLHLSSKEAKPFTNKFKALDDATGKKKAPT